MVSKYEMLILLQTSPNLAYMSGERVILYTFVLPLSLAFKLSEMHPLLGMSQVSGFYKMRFVFKPGFHLSYETFI